MRSTDATQQGTASLAAEAGLSHVAIIMDGNGRWARARGLPRTEGHRRGVLAVRQIIEHANDRGLRFLTLYAFSSENWSRPADEVSEIMLLFKYFIRRDLRRLSSKGVRVKVLGDRSGLKPDIAALLNEAEQTTAQNTGMTLCVAFNYGARNEMLRAIRAVAAKVASGELSPADISEGAVCNALDTAGMPDPDVIIRTSGEQRLSNFLLWQAAYSEFVFVPEMWPEFSPVHFDRAIAEFQRRDRRYGGLTAMAGGQG